MILFVKCIFFCIILVAVPAGVGEFVSDYAYTRATEKYLMGLCTIFALYQLLGFVCSMIYTTSLSFVTTLWTVCVLVLALFGWYRNRANQHIKKLRRLRSGLSPRYFLYVLMLMPIILQTIRAVTSQITNVDDCAYCAQTTTAVYTNTINQFREATGEPVDPRNDYHYSSLWPIFWASISQITKIHPAIIMRTLVPLFMIPCAYMASYQVFQILLDEDRKKALTAVFLLSVSYEIISCNDGMKQWWLLLISWFGKSVAPNMICPFVIYLFLKADKVPIQKQKLIIASLWIVCLAGCLVSASSFLMLPFLVGILGIERLMRTHEWIQSLKMMSCAVLPLFFLYWSMNVRV